MEISYYGLENSRCGLDKILGEAYQIDSCHGEKIESMVERIDSYHRHG